MNDEIITSYLLGKKAGGGGTPPVYEEKNVSITQNGDSTITAESGYDAISKVNLSVNVPQPSGKISITQNGTDIDVSSYASADVNVQADLSEYFNNSGSGGMYTPYLWMQIVKKIPTITLTGTSLRNAFNYYAGTEIPEIINFSNSSNFMSFCESCSNLTNVDFSSRQFNVDAPYFSSMFKSCGNLEEVNLSSLEAKTNNVDISNMFYYCTKLKKINLSNFAPKSFSGLNAPFYNCNSLEELDISSMTMPSSNFGNMFLGVPANCLIYVKDQTAKDWFTTNWPNLTNVQIKGA